MHNLISLINFQQFYFHCDALISSTKHDKNILTIQSDIDEILSKYIKNSMFDLNQSSIIDISSVEDE